MAIQFPRPVPEAQVPEFLEVPTLVVVIQGFGYLDQELVNQALEDQEIKNQALGDQELLSRALEGLVLGYLVHLSLVPEDQEFESVAHSTQEFVGLVLPYLEQSGSRC